MFKLPKYISLWGATFIIMFALCAPLIGSLTGLLILSQNVSSLISILLNIVSIVILAIYLPVILKGLNNLFNFLKY